MRIERRIPFMLSSSVRRVVRREGSMDLNVREWSPLCRAESSTKLKIDFFPPNSLVHSYSFQLSFTSNLNVLIVAQKGH